MIVLAWINGSLYLELHGRDDGRTRSYVFVQIGILALLSVFTAGAAGTDGAAFAVVYAAFLAVMTWLWQSVRGQDSPEFLAVTRRYVLVMLASTITIGISAILPSDIRIAVWAAYCVAFVSFFVALGFSRTFGRGVVPTHAMTERFGLFTIIVLGEVIIGIVDGLSHTERDPLTIVTGVIALGIGFGFWWVYFDIIGGRLPRHTSLSVVGWTLIHLPITLAIAAAGAAMVSLLEHAHDAHTPAPTAWLMSGSVALEMVSVIVAAWILVLFDQVGVCLSSACRRRVDRRRRLTIVLGYLAPPPWLLVSGLGAILTVTWLLAVRWYIQAHAWPPTQLTESDEEATESS